MMKYMIPLFVYVAARYVRRKADYLNVHRPDSSWPFPSLMGPPGWLDSCFLSPVGRLLTCHTFASFFGPSPDWSFLLRQTFLNIVILGLAWEFLLLFLSFAFFVYRPFTYDRKNSKL